MIPDSNGSGSWFDPNIVRVDPSSALGRAKQAWRFGTPAQAIQIVDDALPEATEEEKTLLLWVGARASESEPALLQLARQSYRRIEKSGAPLAPWAALQLARLIEVDDPEAAAKQTGPLATGWAGALRARRIHARGLERAGRHEEAEPLLRALLQETPPEVGGASAVFPLVRILEARATPESLEEALRLYRRVQSRAPLSSAGRHAAEASRKVLAKLAGPRRRQLGSASVEDALANGQALYRAMRHEDAEHAFGAIAGRTDASEAQKCEAQLMQGRAMLRRRKRASGAEHMLQVASRCRTQSVRAAARFNAARALARLGRYQEAIEQYGQLERDHQESSLADDARYRAALCAKELNDEEAMAQQLATLPLVYPEGDMRGRARFKLAWHLHTQGAIEEAIETLTTAIDEGTTETTDGSLGRSEYWRARFLAELERPNDALSQWESLFRKYPLSYYAQQSLMRIRELDAARAESLLSSMRDASKPADLRFPHRTELEQPGFFRAIDLLRVGDIELAKIELDYLGATGEGSDASLLWLTAALLDRAGALPQASALVRGRLPGLSRTSPSGGKALWRLAYPNAFSPLIEQVAASEEIAPSFVRAIAREESAFNPRAVSAAHAYGLIQLIEPTAQRFASELDLPSDSASLRDPETNLRIGTHYIRFLWDRFAENPALVPAAYNAGHGAVNRWLRSRGDLPLDAFIETIPFEETRRYTRRVLQTYGVYAWLEEEKLPVWPLQLP